MATSVYLGGSGGGGTPASPANSIQFNNAGAFGGNANLEYVTTALATPSAPVITQHGAAGATTYGYEVAWKNIIGITAASAETTTATGNATLTGSNYNIINPGTAPSGATAYYVWRTTAGGTPSTTGFIGQGTIGVPFNDTGIFATLNPTATNTTTGTYDNGVLRLPFGGVLNGNDRPALWIGADEGDFTTEATGAFGNPGLVTIATAGSYDNLFQSLLVAAEGNTNNADPFALNVSVACSGSGAMTAMKVFAVTSGHATHTNSLTGINVTPLRGNNNATVTDSFCFVANEIGDTSAGGAPQPTRQIGYYLPNLNSAMNNYGVYSDIPAASNKWFLFGAGAAQSQLNGILGVGDGSTSHTGTITSTLADALDPNLHLVNTNALAGFQNATVQVANNGSLLTTWKDATFTVTYAQDGNVTFPGTVNAANFQPTSGTYISADSSNGISTTVTTGSLVGKTMTFKNGILTSFA